MSFPALLRCRRGRSYRHRGWFGLGVVLAAVALGGASPEAAAHYIAIDLHPSSGFIDSRAVGVSGGQQVGEGFGLVSEVGFNSSQALLWAGSAASVVNLHPRGFTFSIPGGVSGGQQVGRGRGPATGDRLHALLWAGSAESVIDLHPSGFFSSAGLRISGGQQVGIGNTARGEQHALLWAGSAASVVDLNPSGFNNSFAFGVSGGQQVGAGVGPATGFDIHALLWTGSAASVVDLHPSGFGESLVRDVSGSQQVGSGSVRPSNRSHALLWAASAASAVDLRPQRVYCLGSPWRVRRSAGGLWRSGRWPDARLVVGGERRQCD